MVDGAPPRKKSGLILRHDIPLSDLCFLVGVEDETHFSYTLAWFFLLVSFTKAKGNLY